MKLHYANVFVMLIFSLICCILAMICNKSNCGDNKDRSEAFDGSGAMIGFVLLFMFITVLFAFGKFERFFGLWYFLTIVVAIITASFVLQCSESCDKLAEDTKTATRGIAGFLIPWAVLIGGFGLYKYTTTGEYATGSGFFSNVGQGFSAFSKIKSFKKEAERAYSDLK